MAVFEGYESLRYQSPDTSGYDVETQRNIVQQYFYFKDWSELPLEIRVAIADSESRESAFYSLYLPEMIEIIFAEERLRECFIFSQMFLGLVDANTVGLLSYPDLLRLLRKYEVQTSGYRWQLERDLLEYLRSSVKSSEIRLSFVPDSKFSYFSPDIKKSLIVPDYLNAIDAPLPEDTEDPIEFDQIGVYYYRCESKFPHYYNVDTYVDFCASNQPTRYESSRNCPKCGSLMNPQVFLNVSS